MKRREPSLLQNGILLAGIFIDPKARPSLSTTQLAQAKKAFLKLAVKLETIRHSTPAPAPQIPFPDTGSDDETQLDEDAGCSYSQYLNYIAEERVKNLKPTLLRWNLLKMQ